MDGEIAAQIKPELVKLGQRLRSLRSERGWTLEELAQRAGVSDAYLSRLESGERQPSLAVLFNLARVYGLSLPDLFKSAPVEVTPELKSGSGVIIRADDRLMQKGNGLLYTSLAGGKHLADLHPLRVIVPAKRRVEPRYQHSGEEWLYVLSGQLVLTLAENEFFLNPGDAAHFDAYTPHHLTAHGEQAAEIILVACTPTRSLLESYLYNH